MLLKQTSDEVPLAVTTAIEDAFNFISSFDDYYAKQLHAACFNASCVAALKG